MISIKAILAVTLTGLGAAAMGTNVYLLNHKPVLPPRIESPPARPMVEPLPVTVAVVEKPHVVTIDPVTIYARAAPKPARAAPAPEPQGLSVCSDWRALESGPSGRGVRSLCDPSARD